MSESLVKLDQLVDIALAMPKLGVLDLSALRSLLHILVRKMNLQHCKVELPDTWERVERILKSRPPIAINEYNAGKLVQQEHSEVDNSVIKVKHPKKRSDSNNDGNGIVSNILDGILNGIFIRYSDVDSTRLSQIICSDLVGHTPTGELCQVIVGDMIADAMTQVDNERTPRRKAERGKNTKRERKAKAKSGIESNEDIDGPSKTNVERKPKAKKKCRIASRVSDDTIVSDVDDGSEDDDDSEDHDESNDAGDPIIRKSQIEILINEILQEKTQAKETPQRNDLFNQFEQLITSLGTTEDSENRTEFKVFLQELLDEMKLKIESYLQKIDEERAMLEKPTAKDLYCHAETNVTGNLLPEIGNTGMIGSDNVFESDDDELNKKSMKKPGKTTTGLTDPKSKRFCGGQHTILPISARPHQKNNFKEKCIDFIGRHLKENLQNENAVRKTAKAARCSHTYCDCHKADILSTVHGKALM